MSDVIDWSKAPEGATHYCPLVRSGHWRDLSGSYGRWWHKGEWFNSGLSSSDFKPKCAVARPQPTQWSGEGLPPVGVVCEAGIPHTSGANGESRSIVWIEGRVIAYHEIKGRQYAWFAEDDDGFYPPGVFEFRPIRTPEQIAADERNHAISAIVAQSLGRCDSIGAAYLYDAGYRRKP